MPDSKKKPTLDLAAYRNEELVSEVVDLLSVPETIKTAAVTFIICFGIFVFGPLIFPPFHETWLWTSGWILWSTLGGIAISGFLVPAQIIRKTFDSLIAILTLMSEAIERAINDVARLKDGGIELPSAKELLAQGYSDLLIPIIETAIEEIGGWFGKPLLWIYRMSLGRILRFAIKKMPWSEEKRLTAPGSVSTTLEAVADSQSILPSLRAFREFLTGIRGRVLPYVIGPFIFVALLLASLWIGAYLILTWLL